MNGDALGSDSNDRIEAIFCGALERSSLDDRSRYVQEACAGDEALLRAVEELLQAHSAAGTKFLEDGAFAAGAEFAFLKSEAAGDYIGHYRLLERIGEGGFGTVWMAEQEKPVRRRVALKVIKLGMDTREVIARFEAERQALALMDHPNIAKVLDAGATPKGRPFFVMELVQGTRVTDYCDAANLSAEDRLRLFMQVCQAVQHAHQKGIIHRDLKPSNVLVTLLDGAPVPKVIDFGIAKATGQKLTDVTVFTRVEQMIGTPLYMSPEQADMSRVDVDTRSDIYSLGVLLYELLTGRTPFDAGDLMRRGPDEIRRVIREEDPPRPSTALGTMAEETVLTIARRRQSEPPKLVSLLRGDLDWIVMRALEKDRTRRYETASAFAEDIRRHLASEPVFARPPSTSYRFRQLLKRNKGVFAAGGAVAAALVIGIAVSVWQAVRANTALAELRATAPTFAEQARALAAAERFDEAIDKLDYAAKLRPDKAEYLAIKGDLLQGMLQLKEAAIAYRQALILEPNSARVRANAELCEKLLPSNGDLEKLSREKLSQLYSAMQNEQRPAWQLMPVARRIGEEKHHLLSYWLDRLKSLPIPPERPLEKRLTMRGDGLLALDLSETRVAELKPLEGMPLGELNCTGCAEIKDIAPLRSMPIKELSLIRSGVYDLTPVSDLPSLKRLRLDDTRVMNLAPLRGLALQLLHLSRLEIHDLVPLRGMPLEELTINHAPVTDLLPLSGMPLHHLEADSVATIDFTPLTGLPLETLTLRSTTPINLEFLRGLPLKELSLSNCPAQNLSVLSEVKTLEVLTLPADYHSWPEVERAALMDLRQHPRLRQLGAEFEGEGKDSLQSVAQFWQDWDRESTFFQPLRAAGIKIVLIVLPDRTWAVDLSREPVKDISCLKGAPITRLGLKNTKVSDLSPLAGMQLTGLTIRRSNVADLRHLSGMPLEELDVGETYVTDISPLKGMPLKRLNIEQTGITDLAPLTGMPLQELWTGTTAISDLSPLKQMPIRLLQIDDCPRLTDLSPLREIPSLEQILLPRTASNVDVLRDLSHLRYISFELDRSVNRPSQTAEEFWLIKNPGTQEDLAKEGRFEELEKVLSFRIANRSSAEVWRDHIKWAAVHLSMGNREGYREVCDKILSRFKDVHPEGVLLAVCMAPDSGITNADLQHLLEVAVARSGKRELSAPSQLARGLGYYRMGHFAEAAEWLGQVGRWEGTSTAMATVVLAMAYHQQDKQSEAHTSLDQGRKLVADKQAEPWQDPDGWQDKLIASLLLQEAEALIGDPVSSHKMK